MKRNLIAAAAAVLAMCFLISCGGSDKNDKTGKNVTSEDVRNEAAKTVDTAKALADQKKDEYVRTIQQKMDEYGRKIDALQASADAKMSDLKEDSKAKLEDAMQDLRNKKQMAAEKLDELKHSSADAWQDVKSGMQSALDKLGQAFDKATADFKQ